MHRTWRFLAPVFFLVFLVACGGGPANPISGGGGGGGGKGGGGGSGGGGGGGGGSTTGTPVTVAAGATTSAVNITVATAASTTPPNAEFLGVNLTLGGASTTGDTVSRAQGTATVTMYGPGLSSSMTATILGPADITIGSLSGITSSGGTPGVQFPITLTATTALGARTVVLKAANGDITTFTGGLEVVQ